MNKIVLPDKSLFEQSKRSLIIVCPCIQPGFYKTCYGNDSRWTFEYLKAIT